MAINILIYSNTKKNLDLFLNFSVTVDGWCTGNMVTH